MLTRAPATRIAQPKQSRSKRDICRAYPPDYCNDEEIAYRFQVCVETVRNWRNRGLLPPRIKIFGGLERYRWSEVVDAIEALNLLATDGSADARCEGDPFLEALKHGAPAHE